jgi:hypothetical protein
MSMLDDLLKGAMGAMAQGQGGGSDAGDLLQAGLKALLSGK